MNERMKAVAAIAWFADGYNAAQVASALGCDEDAAQRLIGIGAEWQSDGTLGVMKTTRGADGKPEMDPENWTVW